MTPRERQLAVIRRQPTGRLSADCICVENQGAIAAYLGIAQSEVLVRLGLDGRVVNCSYSGEVTPGLNEWGVADSGDYGTTHAAPLSGANVAAIESYPWPDPVKYDYAGAARVAAEIATTYAVRSPHWTPLFCRVCDLMGMEEALMAMVAEPAVFEAALDRASAVVRDVCGRLLDACGADMPVFAIGDDFATQRGLMMSPEAWRRILKPHYAALFDLGRRRGKPVWFHSCGDVTPVLSDLIDIGMDVWETVQLHTLPMTPADLKREYGAHLTFFGGINTQRLPFITPQQVRDEALECIRVLGEGEGTSPGPIITSNRTYRRRTPSPCSTQSRPIGSVLRTYSRGDVPT